MEGKGPHINELDGPAWILHVPLNANCWVARCQSLSIPCSKFPDDFLKLYLWYMYMYMYTYTHTHIYIYIYMHAKLYIHNLCISCAWLFIPHGFVTKVASSCTGMHKVHFAGGLLIYLLAVPYAQSACCILRLQRSSRSHQVADFLFFLANAWHIGCRGVFWTEWSPFSVVDCSLATPFGRSVRLYSIDPIVRTIIEIIVVNHNSTYHNMKPWMPWSWTSQQHWCSTASSAKRRAMITAIRPWRGSHVTDGLAHHSLRPHL